MWELAWIELSTVRFTLTQFWMQRTHGKRNMYIEFKFKCLCVFYMIHDMSLFETIAYSVLISSLLINKISETCETYVSLRDLLERDAYRWASYSCIYWYWYTNYAMETSQQAFVTHEEELLLHFYCFWTFRQIFPGRTSAKWN